LSGFSRYISSSITADASRDHVDATRTRPQDGKAVGAGASTLRGREPASSDDDGDLSDSDLDLSSEDDKCSSGDKQGLSTGVNIPMGPCRRAALAGMEERGQVLEVDLPQVPRQD
jgi:hypothetical protein